MSLIRGIIKNVLVKVDKFIFLENFIVLDMEEDKEIPIIPGQPFLATGRALIDVQKEVLKLRVQKEEVAFHVFKASKHLDDDPCDESALKSGPRNEGTRGVNEATTIFEPP